MSVNHFTSPPTRSSTVWMGLWLCFFFCTSVFGADPSVVLMPKEQPLDQSFLGLFGPNQKREYFEHATIFPFRADETEFHLTNSWWLAEAAMLAYVDDATFLASQLRAAGLDHVRTYESPESSLWDTQGWIAHNDRYVIVSMRGTDPREIKDLLTDLNFLQTGSVLRGRVHAGFKAGLDDVWTELASHLNQLADGGRKVWFTGHSLGGALAVLAAHRFGRAAGVYTFGSPRVGDAIFAEGYRQPTYRVVHNMDAVTDLPPPLVYHHVGELKYFDRQGRLRENAGSRVVVRDRVEAQLHDISGLLSKISDTNYRVTLPKPLTDHAPIHYVTACWNALVAVKP